MLIFVYPMAATIRNTPFNAGYNGCYTPGSVLLRLTLFDGYQLLFPRLRRETTDITPLNKSSSETQLIQYVKNNLSILTI